MIKKPWVKKEDVILIAVFEKAPRNVIEARLPGRSWTAINLRARNHLHLKRKREYVFWSDKENADFKKQYTTASWPELLKSFPGRNKGSLVGHAAVQGLKRTDHRWWPDEEKERLRKALKKAKNHSNPHKWLESKFPEININTIYKAAKRFGFEWPVGNQKDFNDERQVSIWHP
ncbi:MAG: hypothetical protein HYT03_01845 [Candidatus Harrisonbacteria bacterium]|nr:hypothetical protein [Candidatus Harrisonbacteria bacterium]